MSCGSPRRNSRRCVPSRASQISRISSSTIVRRKSILESKSLKLFLGSFRNHAAFHEDCTLAIGKRVATAIKPKFLRIAGYWYPRGGIPIDVFWQTGKLPREVWLPDPGVSPYRGRG